MTRAGVGYVAVVAAGVSAGALGYAVFWAYNEPEAPPVAMSAPPAQRAPPVKEAERRRPHRRPCARSAASRRQLRRHRLLRHRSAGAARGDPPASGAVQPRSRHRPRLRRIPFRPPPRSPAGEPAAPLQAPQTAPAVRRSMNAAAPVAPQARPTVGPPNGPKAPAASNIAQPRAARRVQRRRQRPKRRSCAPLAAPPHLTAESASARSSRASATATADRTDIAVAKPRGRPARTAPVVSCRRRASAPLRLARTRDRHALPPPTRAPRRIAARHSHRRTRRVPTPDRHRPVAPRARSVAASPIAGECRGIDTPPLPRCRSQPRSRRPNSAPACGARMAGHSRRLNRRRRQPASAEHRRRRRVQNLRVAVNARADRHP